jgi:hypothetical protein
MNVYCSIYWIWVTCLKMTIKRAPVHNSVALVRERTIPTERPPLVGEVSANFCGKKGCRLVSAADSLRQ